MNVLAILLFIAANLFTLKAVYNKPGPEGPPLFIRQVPVLIYHNITNNSVKGSPLYISAKNFARQMKCLHDSGFHTILPNQLEAYYRGVTILPAKPFMISFDDAHIEQYTLATPVINQYGFKAVFFIMTVTIDKKGFLSSVQIKQLAQQGHVTGAHTWDHPNLKRLQPAQWDKQLIQPKKILEAITGKPVDCFAYPFGVWDEHILARIRKAGFVTAFQLTNNCSNSDPLLTIRRIMVNGAWSPHTLLQQMNFLFPK